MSPDETLHPSHHYFVWIQEPLECIRFLPQGGKHLGNTVLPPPASPRPRPLSLSLFVYLSIQQNSTRGLLDLHRLIAHLTCAHIFDVHLTIGGHVRGSSEFQGCFLATELTTTLNLSPLSRGQQLCRTVLRPVVLTISVPLACIIQSWEL